MEELEVLESIYSTDLRKISENDVQIEVESDVPSDGCGQLKLTLSVHYTEEYPDLLPEITIKATEGEIADDEVRRLLDGLHSVGEENIGIAMTFTLVSHLRDELSYLIVSREEQRKFKEAEKERLALEEEEARIRGTPVTKQSFMLWKSKFDKEVALRRAREEDEFLKGLTAKEREEWRKASIRLTGRQLFERGGKNLEDDGLLEEGTNSVDISQYERDEVQEELEDGLTGLALSDSD